MAYIILEGKAEKRIEASKDKTFLVNQIEILYK